MKFNSNSVILNEGIDLKIILQIPSFLQSYFISHKVWENTILKFNQLLDRRLDVSEIINGIKVDVLKMEKINENLFLWTIIKSSDISIVNQFDFIIKGKIVFQNKSSDKVEQIIINDILYGRPSMERCSIFRKTLDI